MPVKDYGELRVKFTTNPLIRHEIGWDFSTGKYVFFVTDPYDPALERQRREDEAKNQRPG